MDPTVKAEPQINNQSKATESQNLAVRLSLSMIKFYQRWFSARFGVHCRFTPSCSRYTFAAIEKYGFIRGWCMGVYRIVRCNPFSQGGFDPVP